MEPPCEPCRRANREYRRAQITECSKGHEFTEENTYFTATGQRRCRQCAAMDPAKCGTYASYRRHRRRGEEPCAACKEAASKGRKKYARSKRKPTCTRGHSKQVYGYPGKDGRLLCHICLRDVDPARCGTVRNYFRHRRNGETPCDDCQEAYRRENRHLMSKRRRGALTPAPAVKLSIPTWLTEMYGGEKAS